MAELPVRTTLPDFDKTVRLKKCSHLSRFEDRDAVQSQAT
jgi:hypothetical protein